MIWKLAKGIAPAVRACFSREQRVSASFETLEDRRLLAVHLSAVHPSVHHVTAVVSSRAARARARARAAARSVPASATSFRCV